MIVLAWGPPFSSGEYERLPHLYPSNRRSRFGSPEELQCGQYWTNQYTNHAAVSQVHQPEMRKDEGVASDWWAGAGGVSNGAKEHTMSKILQHMHAITLHHTPVQVITSEPADQVLPPTRHPPLLAPEAYQSPSPPHPSAVAIRPG